MPIQGQSSGVPIRALLHGFGYSLISSQLATEPVFVIRNEVSEFLNGRLPSYLGQPLVLKMCRLGEESSIRLFAIWARFPGPGSFQRSGAPAQRRRIRGLVGSGGLLRSCSVCTSALNVLADQQVCSLRQLCRSCRSSLPCRHHSGSGILQDARRSSVKCVVKSPRREEMRPWLPGLNSCARAAEPSSSLWRKSAISATTGKFCSSSTKLFVVISSALTSMTDPAALLKLAGQVERMPSGGLQVEADSPHCSKK